AFSGSLFLVESARIAQNPPIPNGVIQPSEPPAIMASASPRAMILKASPIACALVVQAVQVAEFGPLAPLRIETQPEARFTIEATIKNGEIFRGPPSIKAVCVASMTPNPPIPDPI